jgi:hypothetical protein
MVRGVTMHLFLYLYLGGQCYIWSTHRSRVAFVGMSVLLLDDCIATVGDRTL